MLEAALWSWAVEVAAVVLGVFVVGVAVGRITKK
jgi:hypothetical protein